MNTTYRGEMPDLAKLYAEQIKAVVTNPETVIEVKMLGESSWGNPMTGRNAILSMLNADNWREHYEYRIQPDGHHGYIRFSADDHDPLNYGNVYSRRPALSTANDLCLHIELDPEDCTIVRRCEVIKSNEEGSPE